MIAFFDTSVHVDLLRGTLDVDAVAKHAPGPIRLSPVVASELLRGARTRLRIEVERLIDRLHGIEPPSWRAAFYAAGRLLPLVFPDHEEVGIANVQNDVLLALTARATGARLVTRDRHFMALGRYVAFDCVLLP
jgi:predicted nucleic acid-binding protein